MAASVSGLQMACLSPHFALDAPLSGGESPPFVYPIQIFRLLLLRPIPNARQTDLWQTRRKPVSASVAITAVLK